MLHLHALLIYFIIFRSTVHVGAYAQMNADNIPRKGESRKEAKVSGILPVNIQPTKERFPHSQ